MDELMPHDELVMKVDLRGLWTSGLTISGYLPRDKVRAVARKINAADKR